MRDARESVAIYETVNDKMSRRRRQRERKEVDDKTVSYMHKRLTLKLRKGNKS